MFDVLKKAVKKLLGTEIATRSTDPNFYGALSFLPNPDPILRKMGRSQDVYDAIIMDAHVIGELRPIRAGATTFNWKLSAGGDAPEDLAALELAKQVFSRKPSKTTNWSDVIWGMHQAILRGFTVHEVVWGVIDGFTVPIKVVDRPTRRFTFSTDNELRLLTATSPVEGIVVDEYKFLLTQHMASFDNPYGVALLSCCFWPYTFKHNGFRFFVKFCEKYGIPWAIGKYPVGTGEKEQNALANSLAQMVEDAVAAIPDNGSVELIEVSSAGNTLPQERLIDLCNREMSKALTSQTLATEIQGTGSYAAAKTHRNREQDVNLSDRQMDMDSMNTLLSWITEINFANAKPPKFEFYSESEARKEWVDVINGARDFIDIPASFAYTQLQIPIPVDGEAVLPKTINKAATVAQFSGNSNLAHSTNSGQGLDSNSDPSPVTDYTAQLSKSADAIVSEWVAILRAKVDGMSDLATLRDDLLSMYGDLPTDKLAEVMSLAFATADLAGRFDVQQEVSND